MKYFLQALSVPFILGACTTDSYISESRPLRFEDGVTQVNVKFDSSDDAAVGTLVNALDETCKKVFFKDRERESCLKKMIAQGRIVGINKKVATVEFKDDVYLGKDTVYEIQKTGALRE